MALNLNIDPYYDDFDPSKNFHRILFKPGYSVQGRELTQSQTILQNQISNFADHIFSQNTPVTGGKVTTNLNCYYLKLNTSFNGSAVTASDYLNHIIRNTTGDILAKVLATSEGVTGGDPPTLIVTYISGQQFTDAVQLTSIDNPNLNATTIGIAGGTTSTGRSSVASISQGIFYVVNGYSQSSTKNPDGTYSKYSIGNFVAVLPQTIILDKYSNTPSYRVGLEISESIINYIDDTSLLDPAIGSSNYQAPGADRYKIDLTLITLPLDVGSDSQFIELVRINAGAIIKQVDGTVYSVIDDYFAKRDYESNGDYVVQEFKLLAKDNGGAPSQYYSGPSIPGDPNKYDMHIGKGVAYVRGYRIENQSDTVVTSNRARETASINPNSVFIDYGNYFVVDNLKGSFDVSSMPSVDLHCVPASQIVSSNAATYNSTVVGTTYAKNLDFQSSTGANTQSYIFNFHVSDINANTLIGNTASASATTLTIAADGGKFSSVTDAYVGAILTISNGTDAGDARIVTAYNGSTKVFTVNQDFTITPDATSQFTLSFPNIIVESVVKQGTSYALTAEANINPVLGKKNGIQSSDTLLQNPGSPEMVFKLGYPYVANTANATYYATQVFRNQGFNATSNTLTISTSSPIQLQGTVGSPIYGDAFKQLYTLIDTNTGDILDFTLSNTTATLTSTTSVTFTAAKYGTKTSGIDIIASVFISNGDNALIRKTKTLVTGNTDYTQTLTTVTSNTSISLDMSSNPTGQIYIKSAIIGQTSIPLYVTDVKQITKIIDTGKPSTAPTGALGSYNDITTNFILSNGQTDSAYQFASIKLRPGVAKPKGDILVIVDYYLHGGGDGYFTVDSYLNEDFNSIPSYKAKDGTIYNLRDCVDFRPSRKNGTTSFSWEYKTPAATNHGTLIPNNLSNFQSKYNYYLGRKDKLVLTKDSKFLIIEGTSSVSPKLPTEPSGSLVIANLSHDPYTAILPGQNDNLVPANLSIDKVVHKRWTKSDISDLQRQVDNLEYYTSLSVLENNAQSLQVPDVNGLNRFKNGILVDDFSSFAVINTADPAFQANVNIRKKQMGPQIDVNNYHLQNPAVLASLGTLKQTNTYAVSSLAGTSTNIFTLPYTTANVITQQLASNTISVNPFNVAIYEGIATLNPPLDNWCNTQETPAILITDPRMQMSQLPRGLTYLNTGDYQSIPGTTSLIAPSQTVAAIEANYANQVAGLNNAEQSTSIALGMTTINGYVQNSAVLPFIRPQQVIIRCKGMLVNTPVKCWFDGQRVETYLTTPNTIELTGVTGTFFEDDIVGFYSSGSGIFYPIARVVSVYNYPDGTSVRLYVATLMAIPSQVSTTTLVNATFDALGNYLGSSASGTVTFKNGSLINQSTSGPVAGVGGGFTSSLEPSIRNIFKAYPVSNFDTFLNQYGVWGDQVNGTNYNVSYPVVFDTAGNYKFTIEITGTGTLKVNNATIITVSTAGQLYTATTSVAAGTANVSWSATNTGVYSTAAIAVKVEDLAGKVVFNSLTPSNIIFPNSQSAYTMPDGGTYYMGVNKVQLDKNASANNNYYNGSTIRIKSTYVYPYNYGAVYVPPQPTLQGDSDANWQALLRQQLAAWQVIYDQAKLAQNSVIYLAATKEFLANVVYYDGNTRTVTTDSLVEVSMGVSSSYGILTSTYNLNGTANSISGAISSGSSISKFSTDESGQFTCIFNMPGSVFYTGQRIFRVDNRLVDTDITSATTFAEATFTAGGLQSINYNAYTPSVDASSKVYSSLAKQGYNIVSSTSPLDPLAQTFIVSKDKYPNGIFIKSIKLFFASKPTTTNLPIRLSVVGTLNGYPNGQTLPYSRVIVNPDKVNVSATPHYLDPNSYTTFNFQAPVYIAPDQLYAFVIESSSSDYNLYFGQQNQLAIPSTGKAKPTDPDPATPTKIGAAPYVGSLFESQNAITWTADQNKDLMFVIDQCLFDITKTPTIPFTTPQNLPYRKLGIDDVFNKYNPDIINNVYSYRTVRAVPMTAFNIATTDFIPTLTNVNYQYSTMLQSDQSITDPQYVYPGKFGTPLEDNIYLNDGLGARMLNPDSDKSFQLFATLNSADANVSPIIADDGVTLYSVAFGINNMGLSNQIITIDNQGTGYNVNTTSVVVSSPDIGNDSALATFTANTTTGAIERVYFTYPGSGYVTTPTITITDDDTRSGNTDCVVTVHGETSPSGGNAIARYITKKVVMTPGNDSGDMRVYYTAYKPLGTSVYIYYKILNANDTEDFDDQNWQLMTQLNNNNVYSKDRTNLIEYECAPGMNGQADNFISYTSTSGQAYTSFIQFAIKVVMATDDVTNVPFLSDIRAIALPSGTGI
jgi:hypothetical protein